MKATRVYTDVCVYTDLLYSSSECCRRFHSIEFKHIQKDVRVKSILGYRLEMSFSLKLQGP